MKTTMYDSFELESFSQKTRPLTEILYLFCVGILAYSAFLSIDYNSFLFERMIEIVR